MSTLDSQEKTHAKEEPLIPARTCRFNLRHSRKYHVSPSSDSGTVQACLVGQSPLVGHTSPVNDSAQSEGKKTQSMVSHMSNPRKPNPGRRHTNERVASQTQLKKDDHRHGNKKREIMKEKQLPPQQRAPTNDKSREYTKGRVNNKR